MTATASHILGGDHKDFGFSLIEILIVVVLLSILAMIVVPHVSSASADARQNALLQDTRTLRSQIELYAAQHGGRLPHLDENGAMDTANFTNRLLSKTTESGKLDSGGSLGPYLLTWPKNPFCEGPTASEVKFGKIAAPPRNGQSGWYYSVTTGVISPNSTRGAEELDPPSTILTVESAPRSVSPISPIR